MSPIESAGSIFSRVRLQLYMQIFSYVVSQFTITVVLLLLLFKNNSNNNGEQIQNVKIMITINKKINNTMNTKL